MKTRIRYLRSAGRATHGKVLFQSTTNSRARGRRPQGAAPTVFVGLWTIRLSLRAASPKACGSRLACFPKIFATSAKEFFLRWQKGRPRDGPSWLVLGCDGLPGINGSGTFQRDVGRRIAGRGIFILFIPRSWGPSR